MSDSRKSPQEENNQPLDPKASSNSELTDDQLESVAGGAVDVFIKLGTIKGECARDTYKGEIDLLSSTFSLTQKV
jgi:hypothetical protein